MALNLKPKIIFEDGFTASSAQTCNEEREYKPISIIKYYEYHNCTRSDY